MKVIFNKIIPVKGFDAMNFFGLLFVRKGVVLDNVLLRHEQIHTRQMHELFYVFFYPVYLSEWLLKLCFYGKKAYRNISFEREAYTHQWEEDYLEKRKYFSFVKYLFRHE